MSASPIALTAVSIVGIALLTFLMLRPRATLASGVILILLASTKFRHRDSYALLSGSLDAQIFFEIGAYAVLFLISARALLLLPLSSFQISRRGALLGGYVSVALLSALWSASLEITFVRAVQLLILFSYGVVAVAVLGPRRMLRILTGSVVLYVLIFAGMALMFPFAAGTRPASIPRFTWFAVHPITAGVFAATAALFVLVYTLFPRGRERPWWTGGVPVWFFLPPVIWVLLTTHSRAPLFAFTAATAFLIIRKYVVGARALLTSDRLLLALLASAVMLLIPVITGKRGHRIIYFVLRGQTTEEFANMTGRTSLWDVAIDLLLQRPVLGHGYVAAREVLLQQVSWGGHAHNALVDSLFSGGLVGAALLWIPFLGILGSSFLRTCRTPPATVESYAMVCAGMVFLLFNSITGDSFAGSPGYEPLLLFLFVLSHDALDREGAAPCEYIVGIRPPAGARTAGLAHGREREL
jgi:O-antigen ligase